ncbi:helix-hairpin-helix domain-containing protein [Reichenbachiella carrageenanivorans]|uniref:Helix-hairpin-helix domain-containing protein n=1 Tax=Reichenbachiella carrageenanivorans TaxID=2979869 RepID=A0ABY6D458_9BACT|nr:helix-hairpin-helix domain-containing protein [Reichenbachiella carrageenanivorans]UXX80584.1 helix-hairpin-helix domain-containing protein [Reichenbachiella carrageenanivorans]
MLTKLKNRIRTFFGCSASETNGLLLLVPLLFLVLIGPFLLQNRLTRDATQTQLEEERLLKDWLEESKKKLKHEEGTVIVHSFFDPNKIGQNKWIELGFKKKIAERIINYRQKGGSFKEKEDLYKIYGINKKLVTAYLDYIIIPPPPAKPKYKAPPLNKVVEQMVIEKESAKFDLNLSDSSQLQIVKGIGPVLSSRIVKYRESLGGFHSMEQLKEVYGIKPEVYERLLDHFDLLIPAIHKININQDSIHLLANHPYLSYKTSRAIVKYRTQHGNYQSVDELKNIYTLSDSLYQKIAPYLEVSSPE